MATIVCAECGFKRVGCPSNTRLCKLCALLRDAGYWRDQIRVCSQTKCEQKFLPLHRNDRVCGHCDLSPHRGECRWCSEQKAELVNGQIPICLRCAKDPDKRITFIGMLRKNQERRRDENARLAA